MRTKAPLVLLAALLVWGVATLTLLRFDTGAAYPPYSSFRADPVGTKALHAALSDLGTLEVARNFEPLRGLAVDRGTTLIVAGTDRTRFVDADIGLRPALDALAAGGARVVVAFEPDNSYPHFDQGASDEDIGNDRSADKSNDKSEPSAKVNGHAKLADPMVRLAFSALAEDDHGLPVPAEATLAVDAAGLESLPKKILCHTSLWFDHLDASWRVVYSREQLPVVIERRVGKGTMVLVADAMPLSNQGVRFSRESRLLAWILGDARRIIFDETHLGVTAPDGTMALVRRYRLHGVLATLVVLALLFAWRAGSPLVSAAAHAERPHEVAGRDAAAGVAGLLRRGLPPKQLLPAAVETWRTGTAPPPALAATIKALAQSGDDPVANYRRIRATLQQHRHSHSHYGER